MYDKLGNKEYHLCFYDRGAVSDKMLSSINYDRDGVDWSTRL